MRVEPLWMRSVPLWRRCPQRSLVYEEEQTLIRYQICQHYDFGLPSPQNCQKWIFAVYKPPDLPEWTKATGKFIFPNEHVFHSTSKLQVYFPSIHPSTHPLAILYVFSIYALLRTKLREFPLWHSGSKSVWYLRGCEFNFWPCSRR